MFSVNSDFIKLDTENTTLLLQAKNGDLYNLYYGSRFEQKDYSVLETATDRNNACLLFSFYGMGDFRTPSLLLRNADGTFVNKFRFTGAQILSSYTPVGIVCAEDSVETVRLSFTDEVSEIQFLQYISRYEKSDVLSFFTEVKNTGKKPITVESAASLSVDLIGTDYTAYNFTGSWGRERMETIHHLSNGIFINDSKTGTTSAYRNPFFMLNRYGFDPAWYAFNLLYSGNHREMAETTSFDTTRVQVGVSDFCFAFRLNEGETFTSPQAIMLRTDTREEITAQMHRFVSEHILPKRWRGVSRPIVFNNWEGTYFRFDEARLHKLAEKAQACGMELFVLDDGWFGQRNDDHRGLGDWFINFEKLPHGLSGLSEKIHGLGMKFGLWFEPEMINEDSDLFRSHPEYAMVVPGKEPFRMRHQLMLDMTNPAVYSYLSERIGHFIEEAKLDYIKWDFNRYITDPYSPLCAEPGEYVYRYVQSLYSLVEELTERYPQVLFESCASGGARYDLGLLRYMPQVWCSDNTDARERLFIQEGTLNAYPQSTMSAHVSASPNHQSGNRTSIEGRFNVAAFGNMGYELDLCACTEAELTAIAGQTAFYKQYKNTLQFGTYHRRGSVFSDNCFSITVVNEAKTEAVAVIVLQQNFIRYSFPEARFGFAGLDDNRMYRVETRKQINSECGASFTASGKLLNSGELPLGRYLCETDRRSDNSNSIETRMFVIKAI